MAYQKTVWVNNNAPAISAEQLNKLEGGVYDAHVTADQVTSDLAAHKAAATLDHPDGSVTDLKIGDRTADQAVAPTGNVGRLTQFLSWFANRIKAITGATNWYDTPATTLAAAKAHADAAAPHTGHETPAGAQAKADTAEANAKAYTDTHAAKTDAVHGAPTGQRLLHAGDKGVASGLATLDANAKVVQRLAYEGAATGVPTLNASSLVAQDSAYASGVSGFTPATVKAALDALAGVRIVEKGSNANGNYVRWENGLQVCWHDTPGVDGGSGGMAWTFPAAFLSGPFVAVSLLYRSNWGSRSILFGAIGTTACQFYGYGDTYAAGDFTAYSVRLFAIGLWK